MRKLVIAVSPFSVVLDVESITGIAVTGALVLGGRQRNLYLMRLQWGIHLWFFSGLPTEVKDACVHVAESENLC